MFERFTERARRVVTLAQDEARHLGHPQIGTEHLLVGLLREEEGLGAKVLSGFGLTVAKTREQIQAQVPAEETVPTGQLAFTPRSKKVLELALREALSLGHNYVGTEHILLGLVRENGGLGFTILCAAGASSDAIRASVIDRLIGTKPHQPAAVEAGSEPPATQEETPNTLPALLDAKALKTELGISRAAAEAIMRQVPAVIIPGLRKAYCRRADVAALVERSTYQKDEVPKR